MALNIKDSETDRMVRDLAALTGLKITDVVKIAVREKMVREVRRLERGSSLDRIRAIVRAYNAQPVIDPRTAEEMLYDEHGLPK